MVHIHESFQNDISHSRLQHPGKDALESEKIKYIETLIRPLFPESI